MSSIFSEELLQKFFNSTSELSTKAKFWNLPDLPTHPTIYIGGELELTLNGKTQKFSEGAFVYQNGQGKIEAMPGKAHWGGGITVDGGQVRPVVDNYRTGYREGNLAQLSFNSDAKSMRLAMPEGRYGMSFAYPATSHEQLVELAERKNAIMHARTSDGKMIEGFFAEGRGAVMPRSFQTFHDGINIKGGEFLSIHRNADGSVRGLFAYKPYTPKEVEQVTSFGRYSPPGNDVKDLKTLAGNPLSMESSPRLNLETERTKTPWGYKAQEIDLPSLRQHHLDESVRDAHFKQRLAEEFPRTYNPEIIDETKIRESAGKYFDSKAGSPAGQKLLFAEVDAQVQTNLKRAAYYAEKDGLAAVVAESSLIKTPGLIERSASVGDLLASKVGLKLGSLPENASLLKLNPAVLDSSALIEGTIAGSEKSMARSLMGAGRTAGLIALTVGGTIAAVTAVEYMMNRKSSEKTAEEKLSLPRLSLDGEGKLQSLHLKSDIYNQALKTDYPGSLRQSEFFEHQTDRLFKNSIEANPKPAANESSEPRG